MCIAIAIPKGKANFITDDILENCFLVNPDGIGYVYVNEKGRKIHKLFMKFDKFLEQWKSDQEEIEKASCLLHFRATSKGLTNVSNCHPFRINKHQFFIHNGTIVNAEDDPKKEKSDTSMFNDTILKQMPYGWEKNPACKMLIEKFIGSSKVVVLNQDNTFTFFNETAAGAHWHEGIWWSNKHYTGTFSRPQNGYANRVTHANYYRGGHKTYDPTTDPRHPAYRSPRKDLLLPEPTIGKGLPFGESFTGKRGDSTKTAIEFGQCEFCTQSFNVTALTEISFGFGMEEKYTVCRECASECFGEEGLMVN